MKIETFEQLLRDKKGAGARAYVPAASGARQARVAVSFVPGGKVYYYRGSIYAIAAHMDLIPGMNVVADSTRVVQELLSTGHAVGYTASSDTVRGMLSDRGINTFDQETWVDGLECEPVGLDYCDYELAKYSLRGEG